MFEDDNSELIYDQELEETKRFSINKFNYFMHFNNYYGIYYFINIEYN